MTKFSTNYTVLLGEIIFLKFLIVTFIWIHLAENIDSRRERLDKWRRMDWSKDTTVAEMVSDIFLNFIFKRIPGLVLLLIIQRITLL